jgi:Flp pilus assembly protein TadG
MFARLLRDQLGAAMVETALVLSTMLLVVFGSIDLGLVLWQWNSASKATHLGARLAVTMDPVAEEITTTAYTDSATFPNSVWKSTLMGSNCIDPATGDARTGGGTTPYATYCPDLSSVCGYWDDDGTALGALTCTNGFTADPNDDAPFDVIYKQMRKVFPLLEKQDVRIAYQTNGLGFVGRPNGLIMDVSVSIRCKTFNLFALDSLTNAFNIGQCGKTGFPLPQMTATLPSEDMASD